MWDLPPDVLEQKIHPIYSSRLRKRLALKAEKANYNPLDAVYTIPKRKGLKVIPAQNGVTLSTLGTTSLIKAVK